MLIGVNPLIAYGMVGFGAAAYSPAKYGILTEYLPPENWSWQMAGLKASRRRIVLARRQRSTDQPRLCLHDAALMDVPFIETSIDTHPNWRSP